MLNPGKKICLIIPSLSTGGMEKIMVDIGNFIAKDKILEVHLIVFDKKTDFFQISNSIVIHEPRVKKGFGVKIFLSLNLLFFLRKKLKSIKPYSLLSFGSMYNSFVLLASWGLKIRTYVSDRSHPFRNSYFSFRRNEVERHDGIVHFFLRKVLYKKATGIIVQTSIAEEVARKTLKHKNIIRIPNPVNIPKGKNQRKEKIILNVGRFIKLKQQNLLIELFSKIKAKDWKLVFAGDGPELNKSKQLVEDLNLNSQVIFLGNVKNVEEYYQKAEIFAFASISEGFPNALAEALATPLASIAFDCIAGPRDLIKNDFNGFLIPPDNQDLYAKKLKELMEDTGLREKFKINSLIKIQEFDSNKILARFHRTLIQ